MCKTLFWFAASTFQCVGKKSEGTIVAISVDDKRVTSWQMATTPSHIIICLYFSSLLIHFSSSAPSRLTIGVHPSDEKYYESAVIKCKDGSKSFTRDRLNDNFCDCPDGSDEPGTSACPTGTFYCKNMGSTPKFLFSSFVNDHICDCCDGSDEYDGKVMCPNTCIMGGGIVYQRINYDSKESNLDFIHSRKYKFEGRMGDSTLKLIGLKTLVYLQVAFVIFVMAFRLYRQRKARRRNSR